MKDEPFELVHGSGNIYRDFGHPDPDVALMKALLAAQIIKTLNREKLTVRGAYARTGISAADFSRIRNADLGRFALDRAGDDPDPARRAHRDDHQDAKRAEGQA
ncbi:MAG TPA: XRE family transcriptional regulator [Acidobacteriaceae bacterium]|nr:XRE family transcriptional regulator [Acidobacteriaceae bacterium]